MIHIYFLTAHNELAKTHPHLTVVKHPEVDYQLFAEALSGEPTLSLLERSGLLPSGAINPALLAGLLLAPWRKDIRIAHIDSPTEQEYGEYATGITELVQYDKPHHIVLAESEPFGSVYAAIIAKRSHDIVLPASISSLHISESQLILERGQLIAELADDGLPHTGTYHSFTVNLLRHYHLTKPGPKLILSGGYMPLMALLESQIDQPCAKIATSIFLDGSSYYWQPVVRLNEEYMLPRPTEGLEAFYHAIGHKEWFKPYYEGHVKEGAGLGYALTMTLSMLRDPSTPGYKKILEHLRETAAVMDEILHAKHDDSHN